LPESDHAGAAGGFVELASKALSEGIFLAIFQPFGTPDKLLGLQTKYTDRIKNNLHDPEHDHSTDEIVRDAYFGLSKIALKAREDCRKIRNLTSGDNKNNVALYEAEKTKEPSITASGVQSMLYYAISEREEMAFQSVRGPVGVDLFFELPKDGIFPALSAQFHPIVHKWKSNLNRSLPTQRELESTYGIQTESKWDAKWCRWNCPETMSATN